MKPKWTPIRVKLGQIKAWEGNPRMSTKAQAQRIINSERTFGQPVPFLLAPEQDGKFLLYDGHQRLSAWFTVYGAEHVMDAMVADRKLTEAEHKELIVTLHTGATGQWDWQALSGWSAGDLQSWGMNADTLKQWNNDANNLKELLKSETAEPVDAEPQIDRAEELAEKWQTASGQLWKLGEHCLLIGDCTVRENVERLMGGERAVVMFTDPPYSFETDGGWFNGKRPKVMDDIKENGTNIFDPLPFLATLKDVFPSGYHSSFIFCNKALIHQYLGFAVENGFSYNILVWKKQNVVPFGDSHFPDVEYLIFIRKGAKWNNGTDANRSKVLVYDQDFETQKDHPTPKPLKLVENELILTTGVGDCIYEPFAGSGTTIIAAHNLNRRCYAMEISEKYGAVILERFQTATGITPVLID